MAFKGEEDPSYQNVISYRPDYIIQISDNCETMRIYCIQYIFCIERGSAVVEPFCQYGLAKQTSR